jgi:hypothetical protein
METVAIAASCRRPSSTCRHRNRRRAARPNSSSTGDKRPESGVLTQSASPRAHRGARAAAAIAPRKACQSILSWLRFSSAIIISRFTPNFVFARLVAFACGGPGLSYTEPPRRRRCGGLGPSRDVLWRIDASHFPPSPHGRDRNCLCRAELRKAKRAGRNRRRQRVVFSRAAESMRPP